jgi:hypothetical protein
MSKNVISICDCSITDSIFNIKKSLEEPTICRVRKIFAVPYCEQGENKPIKKRVYAWVEWGITNAACMFTARLNHHGEEVLFKLDNWDQPIVTAIDEYGNPTQHAHWVVNPVSKEKIWEDELYFGSRDSENWEKYLAPGESIYDIDEEAEPAKEEKIEAVPSIPKLERNNPPVRQEKPANAGCLSLFLPEPDQEEEEECVSPETDDELFREMFIFPEPQDNIVYANHSSQLSRKELHLLSCGKLKCYGDLHPEFMPINKEVTLHFTK